jgi:hypothetical protein
MAGLCCKNCRTALRRLCGPIKNDRSFAVEKLIDFCGNPFHRKSQRFVDVDVILGRAPRSMAEQRFDSQLRKAHVARYTAEGVTQHMRRYALDPRDCA